MTITTITTSATHIRGSTFEVALKMATENKGLTRALRQRQVRLLPKIKTRDAELRGEYQGTLSVWHIKNVSHHINQLLYDIYRLQQVAHLEQIHIHSLAEDLDMNVSPFEPGNAFKYYDELYLWVAKHGSETRLLEAGLAKPSRPESMLEDKVTMDKKQAALIIARLKRDNPAEYRQLKIEAENTVAGRTGEAAVDNTKVHHKCTRSESPVPVWRTFNEDEMWAADFNPRPHEPWIEDIKRYFGIMKSLTKARRDAVLREMRTMEDIKLALGLFQFPADRIDEEVARILRSPE